MQRAASMVLSVYENTPLLHALCHERISWHCGMQRGRTQEFEKRDMIADQSLTQWGDCPCLWGRTLLKLQ